MKKIIYIAAFLFIVIWVNNRVEQDKPFVEAEKNCLNNAIGYDDMQECFKLMDKHKAERDKR